MNIRTFMAMTACLAFLGLGAGCASRSFQGMLTWEEYDRLPRIDPYVLELECGPSRLLYYGAFHSVDLKHPQFRDIERRWIDFKPDVALCEGGLWPLEDSQEEAIRLYGEQGLLRFLANKDRVSLRCLDATLIQQARFLSLKYTPLQIKVFFVLRQTVIERMRGWDATDPKPIQDLLDKLKQWPHLASYPGSLVEVVREARLIFPELDAWERTPGYFFTLPDQGKFLPEMFQAVNQFRDQQMLREVLGELEKGRRVFALVGRSHVAIQTPVILAKLPDSLVLSGPAGIAGTIGK